MPKPLVLSPIARVAMILFVSFGFWLGVLAVTEMYFRGFAAVNSPLWLKLLFAAAAAVTAIHCIRSKTFCRRYDPGMPINRFQYERFRIPPPPRLPDISELEQSPEFDKIIRKKRAGSASYRRQKKSGRKKR